jgi:ribosome-associated toxin RatA of RatAB toxin-antitoxin module
MAEAEFREVLGVDKDRLFQAITRYEDYPEFVEGCTAVTVERKAPGQARATYRVSVMGQDMSYTLEHREDPERGRVEWSLVESGFFKRNEGRWELKAAGPGRTDARYVVDLEFKVPVPGFILNRLVKGRLPDMVRSFEAQAKRA